MRRDQGDIGGGESSILKRTFDECASFTVQSAAASLEVGNERVEFTVGGERAAGGKDVPVLH